MEIRFDYTPKQEEVFFGSSTRFKTLSKGRRVGFTHGLMRYLVDTSIDAPTRKVLWVDTVHGNIRNYIERYMLPDLKQLPKDLWEWNITQKLVRVVDTVIDFRSADKPENIEGFGYDLVILNEAGIILKNDYLWYNAIRPMLLDNPNSKAFIGGVPKGKNLFATLIQKGLDGEANWEHFTATTYDNPLLKREDIDALIKELGDNQEVIRQEIYGEVIDGTGLEYFTYSELENSARVVNCDTNGAEVWGLDVARHGKDFSVLARRRKMDLYKVTKQHIPDTMEIAEWLLAEYNASLVKPIRIFIDATGMGWGVYDRSKQLGLPVIACVGGNKSYIKEAFNKRAEMYYRLKQWLMKGGRLVNNKALLLQLASTEATFNDKGELVLVRKDKMQGLNGKSPDEADAVALTFYTEDELTEKVSKSEASIKNLKRVSAV